MECSMTFFNAFNDGLAEPIAPYQLLSARLNDWDQHNDNMTGHDLGDLSLNAAELTDADWGFIDFSGQADVNALGTDSSKIPYFPSALPSLALLPIASPSTLQGPPGNLLANTDSSTPLADLPTRNRRLNACAELEMFSRLSLNTPESSPAESTINPTLASVSSPDAAAYTLELFDIEPVTDMSFLSPSSLSTSDNSSGPSLFSSPSPSDMYSDADATTPTNNYPSSSSPPPRRLTRSTGVERRAKAIRRIRRGVGLSIGRGTINIRTALRNNSESPSVSESESESDSDFESDLGEPVPSGNPKRPFGCGRELEAVGVPCKRTFTRKHDWNRHQRNVHSEKRPYECYACGKNYKRSDARNRHWDSRSDCELIHASKVYEMIDNGVAPPDDKNESILRRVKRIGGSGNGCGSRMLVKDTKKQNKNPRRKSKSGKSAAL